MMPPCRSPIVFDVVGTPCPKGRPRVTSHGTFTPKRTRAWEAQVGMCALVAGVRAISGEVQLEIWLDDALRGDADNYAKAIADGLNGIAYADDSQIKALTVHMVPLALLVSKLPDVRCRVRVSPCEQGWGERVAIPDPTR